MAKVKTTKEAVEKKENVGKKEVDKLVEDIQEKYELVNAKVREAMKENRAKKVGHDYKLLLMAIEYRPKVVSKAILNMIAEEVKYVNFVQKRTYNFLKVFASGSRAAEQPAQ